MSVEPITEQPEQRDRDDWLATCDRRGAVGAHRGAEPCLRAGHAPPRTLPCRRGLAGGATS